MENNKIKELLSKMTLEEKAGICSGTDFWHTKALKQLGIQKMMLSDGPFGLRKQEGNGDHLGLNDSIQAVSFPAGCATASSFDRALLTELGEILGNECQAEGVGVLLGPAMNIKRSPLCGRNFEYYSEDPYVSTQMANAYIKGLQSKNVGASPKHFYGNNMEDRRMTASSEIDERTEREIYLASFETAVKEQKPWTIMCSYNKINGTYAAENKQALTEILRDEWGFNGFVVSDWGATNDRVPDLQAGMDLEMPTSNGINDRKIVQAVLEVKLDEEVLNQACERILNIIFRFHENRDNKAVFDREKDHEKAGQIAKECMVLLKNDGILPLKVNENIAFIGKYAQTPRYQGGGSSHINSSRIESVLDAVKGMDNVVFAKGYDDADDKTDVAMLEEAVKTAAAASAAVIFIGLPDTYESEGYDRMHMQLPPNQNRLVEEICKVQKHVAVVLHNGSPVEMPWIEQVSAVLESYLGGEAVGKAQADLLFGRANPCGRLAETFPLRLEDNPTYLHFKPEQDKVFYQEGVFIGYRYYDSVKHEVLFPFGHGLSYTEFTYSNLKLDKTSMNDNEILMVCVDVKNTGSMAGKEVVQLYVAPTDCGVSRPAKELKGFEKIYLEPGETKTVVFRLDKRSFAYWDVRIHDWYVKSGTYQILIGKSSADIQENQAVEVISTTKIPVLYTKDTAMGDVLANPEKMEILAPMLQQFGDQANLGEEPEAGKEEAITQKAIQAMMVNMPLRSMTSFGGVDDEKLEKLLQMLNK